MNISNKTCTRNLIMFATMAFCIGTSHTNSHNLQAMWKSTEMELPYLPSTRTKHSAKSIEQLHAWVKYQEKLRVNISTVGRINMLFLGDSITESLVGTSYGSHCSTPYKPCGKIAQV